MLSVLLRSDSGIAWMPSVGPEERCQREKEMTKEEVVEVIKRNIVEILDD